MVGRHAAEVGNTRRLLFIFPKLENFADIMNPSPMTAEDVRKALDGLNPADIPIACSKRLTLRIQLKGQLFQIGRIPPWRAFVLQRGQMKLIYVAASYRNYRYVARRLHNDVRRDVDYDHALGRALAKEQGISYVLLVRCDPKVNRSHGTLERPLPKSGICLRKIFHYDERILEKILGKIIIASGRSRNGYKTESFYRNNLTPDEWVRFGAAIGLMNFKEDTEFLKPIDS